MKYIFINFINTLRHYKASSLLNIIGMAVAFAAFYIILTQVVWGFSYNKGVEDGDRIFLMVYNDNDGVQSNTCRPYAERTLCAVPEVESYGIAECNNDDEGQFHYIKEDGKIRKFTAYVQKFTQGALTLFKFEEEQGSFKDLAKPRTCAVSAKFAKENNLKIGDKFSNSPEGPAEYEIVAIWKDKFPKASALGSIKMLWDIRNNFIDEWSEFSFEYFVKLKNADVKEAAEKNANIAIKPVIEERYEDDTDDAKFDIESYKVKLIPLNELYYRNDVNSGMSISQEGNKTADITFLAVAILIIIIAMINFINFFFALVPARIRSVNTYKVYGTSRMTLVGNFVMESVGLVLLALMLAAVIIVLFERSSLTDLLVAPIDFASNGLVLLITVSVTLLGAVVGSLYPAYYITSFQPAFVLKGSFGTSRSGKMLRNILIGVQFTISIGLIICAIFIKLQQSYMMNYDMGFNKQYLISGSMPRKLGWKESMNCAFTDKLKSNPDIADITWADGNIVSRKRMAWGYETNGVQIYFVCYPVAYNFLNFMGIDIIDGRDFLIADDKSENGVIIFTETTQKKYDFTAGGFAPGIENDSALVAGICKDFHFLPLQYSSKEFAFYLFGNNNNRGHCLNHIYLRTTKGADPGKVMDFVKKTALEILPNEDPDNVELRIFDEELASKYEVEAKIGTLITIFTIIAIIISLMGVFGLVLFETQHRKKEIAIRRVLGAEIDDILKMFCLKYSIIVVVCFVIASPLCWLIINRYFSTFAYHMQITWWVFALAFVVVLVITNLVVAVRCFQTASSNPVDSIKTE